MSDFPDLVEVLVAALTPVADTRTERTAGDPLPSVQVRRANGGDDGLTDLARLSVSAFAATEAAAADLGKVVAVTIRDLSPRFGPQKPVTTEGGEVWLDSVRFIERFRPESYAAEPTVHRHRVIIEIAVRLH